VHIGFSSAGGISRSIAAALPVEELIDDGEVKTRGAVTKPTVLPSLQRVQASVTGAGHEQSGIDPTLFEHLQESLCSAFVA